MESLFKTVHDIVYPNETFDLWEMQSIAPMWLTGSRTHTHTCTLYWMYHIWWRNFIIEFSRIYLILCKIMAQLSKQVYREIIPLILVSTNFFWVSPSHSFSPSFLFSSLLLLHMCPIFCVGYSLSNVESRTIPLPTYLPVTESRTQTRHIHRATKRIENCGAVVIYSMWCVRQRIK